MQLEQHTYKDEQQINGVASSFQCDTPVKK